MKPLTIGSKGIIGKCLSCGKEFTIGNAQFGFRRKYCSVKCIKDHWRKQNLQQHNLTNKKWRESNPNYFTEYRNDNFERLREYHIDYNKKHYIPRLIDKTMLGKSAHAKGKLLENYIVDRLRISNLDIRARRTYGSGSGREKGDINNDLDLSIECKNQKKFSLSFWKQCQKQAEMTHDTPVLVYHLPNEPIENSFVIIDWDYYEELLKKTKEPPTPETSKELRWRLKRFLEYAKDLIKELEN